MIERVAMRSVVAVSVLAMLLGPTGDARGGVITSISTFSLPGASTGSISLVGATPAPNNDDAAPSPNTISSQIFFNTFGPAEIEFVVADSGGTTEYLFTQTLINNTGRTWTDFHFELGFGTGTDFMRSGALDALDLDTSEGTPAPTSSVFTVLVHGGDTIDWSGGSVGSIGVVSFTLSVDVPDGLSSLNPSGSSRFTLREVPTTASAVPEPVTVLLLAGGLLAAGVVRRRRPDPI